MPFNIVGEGGGLSGEFLNVIFAEMALASVVGGLDVLGRKEFGDRDEADGSLVGRGGGFDCGEDGMEVCAYSVLGAWDG